MQTPDYYKKIGFEDNGYVSPELSGRDEYPDYIKAEVEESIKNILSYQNENTFTFGFMTDLHYALSDNHYIRMKRNINSYREISKRASVKRLMLGGDYTNEGCKEYKSDCFIGLRDQLSGVDYFPVNGNHDDGTIWDDSYILSDISVNHLTHKDLYNLFYDHLPDLGVSFGDEDSALYYFFNDEINKVRFICIDSNDIPYLYDNKAKLKVGGQHLFAMSQKQLDWLANKALFFEEEGWSVLFFAHSYIAKDYKDSPLVKNLYGMHEIIAAFKNRTKCDEIYGEELERHICADFTKGISAEIIGCFIGDYHTDDVCYDRGVPYILTANSVMYYSGASYAVPRYDGDKTELLYDVVTVDKKIRKIYLTRVGAGEDRVVEY